MGTIVPCGQTEGIQMLFNHDDREVLKEGDAHIIFNTSAGSPSGPAGFLMKKCPLNYASIHSNISASFTPPEM